jgi:hypothetical protein
VQVHVNAVAVVSCPAIRIVVMASRSWYRSYREPLS